MLIRSQDGQSIIQRGKTTLTSSTTMEQKAVVKGETNVEVAVEVGVKGWIDLNKCKFLKTPIYAIQCTTAPRRNA